MRNIVKFLTEFFLMAFLGMPLAAQTLVDHWSTSEQALAATSAPFYYPTLVRQQKLAENEVIRGLPQMSAVDMDLPDRMGGRGWVKIEAGRRFVFNRDTGQTLRLAECNNRVYSVVPFPPLQGLQGPPGPMGPRGYDGRDGRDAEYDRRERLRENLGKVNEGSWVSRHPIASVFIGTVVVGTIVALTRHHGGDNNGTPPGGSTGPAH